MKDRVFWNGVEQLKLATEVNNFVAAGDPVCPAMVNKAIKRVLPVPRQRYVAKMGDVRWLVPMMEALVKPAFQVKEPVIGVKYTPNEDWFLNESIDLFKFTTRTRNSLATLNIKKIRELVQVTDKILMGLANFGSVSLNEIKEALKKYDLTLGMKFEVKPEVPEDPALAAKAAAEWLERFEELLDKSTDFLELTPRSSNCLKVMQYSSIRELVKLTEDDLIRIPNLGRKGIDEIKGLLEKQGLSLGMKLGDEKEVILTQPDEPEQLEASTSPMDGVANFLIMLLTPYIKEVVEKVISGSLDVAKEALYTSLKIRGIEQGVLGEETLRASSKTGVSEPGVITPGINRNKFDPKKAHKKKILVVGPRGGGAIEITSEFEERCNLKIYNSDQSPDTLKGFLTDVEEVVVMSKFCGHAQINMITSRFKGKIIYTNGGYTGLKETLRTLI